MRSAGSWTISAPAIAAVPLAEEGGAVGHGHLAVAESDLALLADRADEQVQGRQVGLRQRERLARATHADSPRPARAGRCGTVTPSRTNSAGISSDGSEWPAASKAPSVAVRVVADAVEVPGQVEGHAARAAPAGAPASRVRARRCAAGTAFRSQVTTPSFTTTSAPVGDLDLVAAQSRATRRTAPGRRHGDARRRPARRLLQPHDDAVAVLRLLHRADRRLVAADREQRDLAAERPVVLRGAGEGDERLVERVGLPRRVGVPARPVAQHADPEAVVAEVHRLLVVDPLPAVVDGGGVDEAQAQRAGVGAVPAVAAVGQDGQAEGARGVGDVGPALGGHLVLLRRFRPRWMTPRPRS